MGPSDNRVSRGLISLILNMYKKIFDWNSFRADNNFKQFDQYFKYVIDILRIKKGNLSWLERSNRKPAYFLIRVKRNSRKLGYYCTQVEQTIMFHYSKRFT